MYMALNRWVEGLLPGNIQSAVCCMYVRAALVRTTPIIVIKDSSLLLVLMYVCSGMHAVGLALNALLVVTEIVIDDLDAGNRKAACWLHAHKLDSCEDAHKSAVYAMFHRSTSAKLEQHAVRLRVYVCSISLESALLYRTICRRRRKLRRCWNGERSYWNA